MSLIRALIAGALDVLAPSGCAACDAEVATGTAFCASCGASIRAGEPALLAGVPVLAGAAYRGSLVIALQRFKYSGRSDLAPALSSLARAQLESLDPCAGDLLVPVPLHGTRLAERGYNQSALLARSLAGQSAARVLPRALVRVRATAQQARLARSGRAENTAGAFVAGSAVSGRRVVLVDDVVTTGATALDCVRALTERGARVLGVLAVARATPRTAA